MNSEACGRCDSCADGPRGSVEVCRGCGPDKTRNRRSCDGSGCPGPNADDPGRSGFGSRTLRTDGCGSRSTRRRPSGNSGATKLFTIFRRRIADVVKSATKIYQKDAKLIGRSSPTRNNPVLGAMIYHLDRNFKFLWWFCWCSIRNQRMY